MTHRTSQVAGCTILFALAVGLGGCGEQPEAGELQWARAALERNANLEVVAVDRDARVFTVRERDGGALHTVALADVVAGPAALMEPRPREMQPEADDGDRELVAGARVPDVVAAPESVPEPAPPAASAAPRIAADAAANDGTQQPESPSPVEAARASTVQRSGYTIERADGRVRVSGPGFSIMSAESSGGEIELAAQAPRRDEPIICAGSRMMHLDGRTLAVDGDAIIARNGCDLHITNSRITATGVAVTVANAKVHITNSTLAGGLRSLEIADRGQAYLRASTLDGIVQRFGAAAELHDLGGNDWN